jgi:hypothetical protein
MLPFLPQSRDFDERDVTQCDTLSALHDFAKHAKRPVVKTTLESFEKIGFDTKNQKAGGLRIKTASNYSLE